ISGTLAHRMIFLHQRPTVAAIFRPVEPWFFVFHQRIHNFWVGVSDVHRCFSNRVTWSAFQSIAKRLPCFSAILRTIDSAEGTAAAQVPCFYFHLPHRCEEVVGVLRIHREIGTSCIFIEEEYALPVFSAIRCFVNTPLLLRSMGMAQRRYING